MPPDPLIIPYDRGWYRGLLFLSTIICTMLQYLFLWGCNIDHSALETTTLATIDILDLLIVGETTPTPYRRATQQARRSGGRAQRSGGHQNGGKNNYIRTIKSRQSKPIRPRPRQSYNNRPSSKPPVIRAISVDPTDDLNMGDQMLTQSRTDHRKFRRRFRRH